LVARNRKRAKERRARRPAAAQVGRTGYGDARDERNETPSPIEHATPDVELANAQLALGRPELADAPFSENEVTDDESYDEDGASDSLPAGGGGGGGGGGYRGSGSGGLGPGGELAPAGRSLPDRRRFPGIRLINFLQGSWRELQRVQWPDRRQVMQATGVVIGFVIVAGVFLGVCDLIATKIVNIVLTK
jgi:preprotein translocase SecE subunit